MQRSRELLNGPGWWEPCGFKQAQNRQSSENRFSPSAELAPCSTGNVVDFHKKWAFWPGFALTCFSQRDSSLLCGWINWDLSPLLICVFLDCKCWLSVQPSKQAPKMLIHCWSSEEEVQAASTKATWLAPGSLVALGGFPEVCFDGNTVMHNSPPSKDLATSFQNASYLLQWNSKMRELHTYQKKSLSSTAAVMQKTISS